MGELIVDELTSDLAKSSDSQFSINVISLLLIIEIPETIRSHLGRVFVTTHLKQFNADRH